MMEDAWWGWRLRVMDMGKEEGTGGKGKREMEVVKSVHAFIRETLILSLK